jgi:uncharacterized protein (TIGR00369 family)
VPDERTLQAQLDEAPLHAVLGDLRVMLADGAVRIDGSLSPVVENGSGTGVTHGGVLATLLDTAMTFALIAETDRDWSTVDLRVDYLRPVGIGTVGLEGRVVHAGRRTGRAEGRLTDGDGTTCAIAVGTFVPTD